MATNAPVRTGVKKLVLLALASAVLLVGVASVPQDAGAATLAQRVAKLEAKLACLQYTGLSEWVGYASIYGGEYTAAGFDQANGYPASGGDYRIVTVKPTSTCRAKFPVAANQYDFFTARATAMAGKETAVEKERFAR